MLIWAPDRPERNTLALPEGVELQTVPARPKGHPDRLWSAPNLLLTPHIAGDTPRRFRRSWQLVGEQVERLRDGRPPLNPVRAQAG